MKLHRFVDWDLDSEVKQGICDHKEDGAYRDIYNTEVLCENTKDMKLGYNGESDGQSRLLPFLFEEEVSE